VNFADFACGTANARPGRLQKLSAILATERGEAVRYFLDRLAAGSYADSRPSTALLGELYLRCRDSKARDLGLAELRIRLDAISRLTTLPELAQQTGALRARGIRALVAVENFYQAIAKDEPVIMRIRRAPPALGRKHYSTDDRLVDGYRTHLETLAALTGVISHNDIEAALRIDRVLAASGAPMPDDFTADLQPLLSRSSLEQRRFPWLPYLSGLGLSTNAPIRPAGPQAMADVDALAALPIPDLKSYLKMRVLENAAESLSVPVFKEEIHFHWEVLGGSPHEEFDLAGACAELTSREQDPLLEEALLRSLSMPSEEPARELFAVLRDRFAQIVAHTAWLDTTTRQLAATKVSKVSLRFLGDPVRGYDGVVLQPGSLLDAQSVLATRSFAVNVLAMIGSPVRPASYPDYLRPAQSGFETNSIWVAPEFARPPWIHTRPFDAVNFGSLGTTMAHEIAHTLTIAGRRFDATGVRRESWPKEAVTAFDARRACLEGELRSRDTGGKWTVDAHLTLDEDLTDLVGIRLALAAMESEAGPSTSQARDDRRRTFFIAFAQQRCGLNGDHANEDTVENGHSPLGRVLRGILANVPEFAETFHCAAGMSMAPGKRCELW
jgi:predicted metalloendopeptidase